MLDHEVVSAALKKLRQGMPAQAFEQALADYPAHDIELMVTDLNAQCARVRLCSLTANDAAYLWLAAELRAPLATFDRQLANAARQHLGALE